MANGIGTIQVKTERGTLVVQGLGRSPRGTKYIKETLALKVTTMASKDFKAQMSTAVKEMMAETLQPL